MEKDLLEQYTKEWVNNNKLSNLEKSTKMIVAVKTIPFREMQIQNIE